MGTRKLAYTAFGAAAAVALLAPASAFGLSFANVSAAPDNPDAGANSNFNIHMEFNEASDQVKDLTIHLPPGLVGNPLVTPLCTVEQLESDSCPAESQVGALEVNLTIESLLTDTVSGALYNLTPQPGEPARFGIVLQSPAEPLVPDTILQSPARLRKSDFGLDSVLTDIPNNTGPPLNLDININSQDITLFGLAGNPPQGFIRNPTSCGTKTTGFDATSYADPSTVVSAEATYDSLNCQNLPFDPAFSAKIGAPGQTSPATKPPLTTAIGQTIQEAGIQRAEVILPTGVGADQAALLNQCPTPDFEASACPPNTLVGSALAASPLQSAPLTGTVSILEPLTPGALPNLGLDLTGALPLQLRGNFVLSPGPGNAFEGLPDIPISKFELAFDQGELITISRNLCEPPLPLFTVTFDGHNGAHVTDQVPATVEGCGPGSGKPTAKVKLTKTGSEHPRMSAKITASFSPIGDATIKLPKQLRLSGGNDFDKGTKAKADGDALDDSALGGSSRKLKVDAGTGAAKLKITAAGDALDRVQEIDGKLRFKVNVTDLAGTKTKLKTKAC
jgi:hypothetical protein